MNVSRETTGFRELEARRKARAFAEISKSWWWFENTASLDYVHNPVEWQWELLRRSNAYRKFYRTADAIRVQDETDRSLKGFLDSATSLAKLRTLAASYSRMGSNDPCHRWTDLFLARCAPNFWWTALPEESRKALSAARPLYPRAEIAAAFTPGKDLQVEAIIVKRPPSGQEELTPLTPISSVTLGRYQTAGLLSAILPEKNAFGTYAVVVFDVRSAESTLTRLKEQHFLSNFTASLQNSLTRLQTYLKDTNQTAPTPRLSSARVFGSNVQFWCQAWIPTDIATKPAELLARFRTLIDSRQRRIWLLECEKVWRELFPSFQAESVSPLKAKRARIKDVRDMQAGLCAYDCRQIETRFTKNGLLIPFLEKIPNFKSLADADRLHAVRLQVSRIIKTIDTLCASLQASF